MTGEDFLAAIRAAPEDDAPRLVYADWLEDNGDPERAEFIRAQVRMAGMSWREPGHSELEKRASRLEWDNRKRWLKGFPPELLGGRRQQPTYRRGFVDEVELSPEELLKHGPALLDRFPIRVVHLLGKLGKPEAQSLAASPVLARVAGLRLGHGDDRCNKDGLAALLASPHLTALAEFDLKNYRVSLAALRVLARAKTLPGLCRLSLQDNSQLGDAGMALLAQAPFLEQLTHLSLGGTGIGDAGAQALAGCGRLRNLRSLELAALFGSGNRVGAAGTKALLAALPALSSFWVPSNPIGPGGAEALAAWPGLARSRELNLEQCALGSAGAAALAASPNLSGLTYLRLYSNGIGPEGARALADAKYLTHLRELDLGANEIGDEGAAALARAPHLAGLRELSLWSNKIGDRGAAALAASPHLTNLTELRLYMNEIGDRGAAALARSGIFRRHTKFDLHSNKIGDEGAAALAESEALRGLTEMELHFNEIGAAGMKALAASSQLPKKLSIDLRYNKVERRDRDAVKKAIRGRFSAPKVWV
jgi:uncharacterized protein (TIGR02996 family)